MSLFPPSPKAILRHSDIPKSSPFPLANEFESIRSDNSPAIQHYPSDLLTEKLAPRRESLFCSNPLKLDSSPKLQIALQENACTSRTFHGDLGPGSDSDISEITEADGSYIDSSSEDSHDARSQGFKTNIFYICNSPSPNTKVGTENFQSSLNHAAPLDIFTSALQVRRHSLFDCTYSTSLGPQSSKCRAQASCSMSSSSTDVSEEDSDFLSTGAFLGSSVKCVGNCTLQATRTASVPDANLLCFGANTDQNGDCAEPNRRVVSETLHQVPHSQIFQNDQRHLQPSQNRLRQHNHHRHELYQNNHHRHQHLSHQHSHFHHHHRHNHSNIATSESCASPKRNSSPAILKTKKLLLSSLMLSSLETKSFSHQPLHAQPHQEKPTLRRSCTTETIRSPDMVACNRLCSNSVIERLDCFDFKRSRIPNQTNLCDMEGGGLLSVKRKSSVVLSNFTAARCSSATAICGPESSDLVHMLASRSALSLTRIYHGSVSRTRNSLEIDLKCASVRNSVTALPSTCSKTQPRLVALSRRVSAADSSGQVLDTECPQGSNNFDTQNCTVPRSEVHLNSELCSINSSPTGVVVIPVKSTALPLISSEVSGSLKESIMRDHRLGKVPLPDRFVYRKTPSPTDYEIDGDYHSRGW